MVSNWYEVHVEGLNCVDRDTGIKYFRKCKVTGSFMIQTSFESCNLSNNK